MNFRKSGKLMWTGGILSSIIIVLGFLIKNEVASITVIMTGFVVYLAATIQSYFFYKCPFCKGSLRKARADVPERCPHCFEVLPD